MGEKHSNMEKPRRRKPAVDEPDGVMAEAVEAYIRDVDWLGPEHVVLVASLRRMAATCDLYPELVTAHREVATITRQLNALKPVEDETEPSGLASILERAGNLRAV
jgi:hypothetical protein